MTQEEANKMILDMWPKERLAEEWVREHIKYNELKQENEKLKELCNKYEEEHNTTFKEWQKDIQANKKAVEFIKENQEEEYVTGKPMLSYWAIDNLLSILGGK